MFQLNAPNKSVLSGVTVGNDNGLSIIAPNPSMVQQFIALVQTSTNNTPMTVPVQGVISEELFTNPNSESGHNIVTNLITEIRAYSPPEPTHDHIQSVCSVPRPTFNIHF